MFQNSNERGGGEGVEMCHFLIPTQELAKMRVTELIFGMVVVFMFIKEL